MVEKLPRGKEAGKEERRGGKGRKEGWGRGKKEERPRREERSFLVLHDIFLQKRNINGETGRKSEIIPAPTTFLYTRGHFVSLFK